MCSENRQYASIKNEKKIKENNKNNKKSFAFFLRATDFGKMLYIFEVWMLQSGVGYTQCTFLMSILRKYSAKEIKNKSAKQWISIT